MSRYSVGRKIARDIMREEGRKATGRRIQKDAAARPESKLVKTPFGEVWMSPIEFKLYEAMRQEGLSPTPQHRIEAYFVDFAFPDIKLAIEADGLAFHTGDRRERDRNRDRFLARRGWTVKRFHGTTIHQKAGNCAYVIKQEVDTRRRHALAHSKQKEKERQARNEAIARPFRKIARMLRRS